MASEMSSSSKRTKGNAAEEYPDIAASSSQIQLQQLLPGIPDHITLSHITTKLTWADSHVLPSLSHSWDQAIRSRQVFDARVRSQSTETVVICGYKTAYKIILAVYSMRSKKFYPLPPIPGVPEGIPVLCQCVSLDGRIYVLGGLGHNKIPAPGAQVYVLDLIGQRKWRICADMPQAKLEFCCCVLDGKIHVKEGISNHPAVRDSFVYDPKVNAWSEPSQSWPHDGAVVGGEVLLPECTEVSDSETEGGRIGAHRKEPSVYDPIRNDRRKVVTAIKNKEHQLGLCFGFYCEVYAMTGFGIDRRDTRKKIRAKVHSAACAALGPAGTVVISPISVVVTNGELLASVWWVRRDKKTCGSCLLQSTGFGDENKVLVWEKVNSLPAFRRFRTAFMCPAQL